MEISDYRWVSGWIITDPLCISFLFIIFLYFVLFEGLAGATPGKPLVGIRVISEGGGRPGLYKALTRNILRIADSLPAINILGVILILKSEQKARFGDRIAGTRVIKRT